jgi:6-methylsalicylate decarboxylase
MFLELAWEPGGAFNPEAHDPTRRLAELDAQGTDLALISISTPVGCEALPPDDAAPLVDAYNRGIAEIVRGSGGRLQAMAAVVLADLDGAPARVEGLLDEGFAGLTLPSEVIASPAALDRVAPLLDVLEHRGTPLLVHPGPAPGTPADPASDRLPPWWTSLALYPAWSQRAFFTWRALGRARHPTLRSVWAILAGAAPQLEHRFRVFSGETPGIDPNIFFDTASYGREAIELTLSSYGAEQVVYGTDHPVIAPDATRRAVDGLGSGAAELILDRNPARLLNQNGGQP